MRPSLRVRVRRLRLPIRTSRLELTSPEPGHVRALVPLLDDRTVARWTLHIPHPYTSSDARRYVRRARVQRQSGRSLGLVIVRRTDGALVGGIGLHNLNDDHASAEIGYWLGRPYRGQGYGSEAARALVKVAFWRLGLHRVEAAVFPGNNASVRLLRGLGFRYEGRARDAVLKNGTWMTDLRFARLVTDPVRTRRTSRKP
jgi:RimJ/RimL family protein N-acetyltransferase